MCTSSAPIHSHSVFFAFISSLTPIKKEDEALWRNFLNSAEYNNRLKAPEMFWYLSSGLDIMPLVHFRRDNNAFPPVDFFLYSDAGTVFNDPENLQRRIKNGQPLALYAGEYTFYLKQFIPLKLQVSSKNTELLAFNNSVFTFLAISPEGSHEEYPLLLAQLRNQELLQILKSFGCSVRYICTVTDGCRSGENPVCPNEIYDTFLPVLTRPGYWITDHFNSDKPPEFAYYSEFSGWGHYDLNDTSYVYRISM